MKTKLIILLATASLFLQACTLRVGTPSYVDAITGEQYYNYTNYYLGGGIEPVFTVLSPYRQMTKR